MKSIKNKIECLEKILETCKKEDYPVFVKQFSPTKMGEECYYMKLDKCDAFALKYPTQERLKHILFSLKKELKRLEKGEITK